MTSILDMGDALKCFQGEVQVLRTTKGRWINGRYHKNTSPDVILIDAVTMPANPKEIEMLPEGQRTKETITVFSSVSLELTGGSASDEPDQLIVNGDLFEPVWKMDWSAYGGYSHYLCTRVGQ